MGKHNFSGLPVNPSGYYSLIYTCWQEGREFSVKIQFKSKKIVLPGIPLGVLQGRVIEPCRQHRSFFSKHRPEPLIQRRNPCPEGQGQSSVALPSERPICYIPRLSCLHNFEPGVADEPISKAITNYCQYHIIWVPKYRFRVLKGAIAEEVSTCVRIFSEQLGCEILEMNIQVEHVHLLVMVPPQVSISGFVGTIKGRTAIRVLDKFRKLKEKLYWGNHIWARGYCVDTVGLDSEMLRKYIKYQEDKERAVEKPQY